MKYGVNIRQFLLFIIALVVIGSVFGGGARIASAAVCTSIGTGNWNTVGTWGCGQVPTSADSVVIANTHTVTIDVDTAAVTAVTIDNGGILTEDGTGKILTVAGAWTNNGTFTAVASTVKFTATATLVGTTTFYKLIFDATTSTKTFTVPIFTVTNLLTISGNANAKLNTGTINVTGDITDSNTVVTTRSIAGPGTATIVINGTGNQTFTGTGSGQSNLPNITINRADGGATTLSLSGYIPVKVLTYTAGTVDAGDSTISFNWSSQTLTSTGLSFNNIELGFGTLTLGSNIDINGNLTRVSGNPNDGGYTINIAGSFNINAGGGTFSGTIIFDSDTDDVTQSLTSSASLNNVTIANTGANSKVQLVTSDLPVLGTITINSGSTLDLNGLNLTTTTSCSNSGTLKLTGDETASCTPTNNSGSTVEYSATSGSRAIKSWDYQNLKINGSGGTFTAPDATINVAGNWINSAGTFTAAQGTINLNGASQTISGANTFYNLTKSVTSAATLTFPAGVTQTITNMLTLNGAAGQLLSLVSSSPGIDVGNKWTLTTTNTPTIGYLSVTDSIKTGTPIDTTGFNITDGGGNTGWTFNSAPTVSTLGPTSLVNGSWTADNTPTFTFTTADIDADNVAYELTIDNNSDFSSPTYQATSTYVAAGAVSTTTGVLADASSYYWRVLVGDGYATSSYSTANSGAIAFKVDATAPTAGTVTFSAVTATTITATATGASDAGSDLAASPYVYYESTTGTYSAATAGNLNLSSLTPNSSYQVAVGVNDLAGNWATSTPAVATTTLANLPTSLSLVVDSASQITISWQANNNPEGTEYYVENTTTGTNSGWITTTTLTSTGLSAATSYAFTIKARNSAGVETSTISDTATTQAAPVVQSGSSSGTVRRFVSKVTDFILPASMPPPVTSTFIVPTAPLWERTTEAVVDLMPDFLKEKRVIELTTSESEVSTEAPPAFKGTWNLWPQVGVSKFVLAPLPQDLVFLRQSFPELDYTFNKLGINQLSDVEKLHSAGINLPGLNEVLSRKLVTGIPTNVIFAQVAGGSLDVKPTLTINNRGASEQKIKTLPNQKLRLTINPEGRATTVDGYLSFNKKGSVVARPKLFFDGFLAAVFYADVPKDTIEDKLVVERFAYTDSDGDGLYVAEINTPVVAGEYEVITVINYADPSRGKHEVRLITVIDPEGYVFEQIGGREARIPEVTVSIFWLNQKTRQYTLWPAMDYSQSNPQVTNKSGSYSFLVPEGEYYLVAQAAGYEPYRSGIFKVVSNTGGVHTNIELVSSKGWLEVLNWQTWAFIAALVLLLYNFYKDKIREKQKYD